MSDEMSSAQSPQVPHAQARTQEKRMEKTEERQGSNGGEGLDKIILLTNQTDPLNPSKIQRGAPQYPLVTYPYLEREAPGGLERDRESLV